MNELNANKNLYKIFIANEEKRIVTINNFEKKMKDIFLSIESDLKKTKYISKTQNYNTIIKKTLNELQELNKNLRETSETANEDYKKNVNNLLSLEEKNFKTTVNIYIKKINILNLIAKEAEDSEIFKCEKEIDELKESSENLRKEINEIINILKYENI